MLGTAAPAHIPHGHRRFVPASPAWWRPRVLRWLFAVGDNKVLPTSRRPVEPRQEQPPAGDPDPAQMVDQLFQEHAHAVLAYLVRRLPTLLDAEDALDDVFLAALQACSSGRTLTGGWLLVTAQRRIADFYRRRRPALPLAAAAAAEEEYAGASSEPEWATLRGEEHRQLLRLVSRLTPEQQEVLALHLAAGLQSPEIGDVIGKRAAAVRALMARAMRRLREEWTS